MRISDWSSDVCSSDLVLRAAIEGEHHRVARDHLEIFAADPGGAYRDRRSQDRLQHDFAVPRHREDKQQDRQCAEADGDDREQIPLPQDPLAVRMAVGTFHITPPSIEGTRVAWLSDRRSRLEEPSKIGREWWRERVGQ